MENKLEVPERTFKGEIKAIFDNHLRAMSPRWRIYSLILGMLFGLSILIFMLFLLRAIDIFIVAFCLFWGFTAFMIIFSSTLTYRKKINDDMKAAKPYEKVYGFHEYTSSLGFEHTTIVPTMAGDLKFRSYNPYSYPSIQKKAGQLFDYYVFNDVENLDKKDLSKFIAV